MNFQNGLFILSSSTVGVQMNSVANFKESSKYKEETMLYNSEWLKVCFGSYHNQLWA